MAAGFYSTVWLVVLLLLYKLLSPNRYRMGAVALLLINAQHGRRP
ncbi:MAG: hypothetical protein RIS47_366 [Bacteroidota bacterium]|jgi:hypothetical protein